MSVSANTYYHRLARNWDEREALNCPVGTPRWMWRIEQDEGATVREILADTAATARQTGYSMADLAREWGVAEHVLQYWAAKWGTRFPNHCSARYIEAARQVIGEVNRRKQHENRPPG